MIKYGGLSSKYICKLLTSMWLFNYDLSSKEMHKIND
jgi:hypothetical protein